MIIFYLLKSIIEYQDDKKADIFGGLFPFKNIYRYQITQRVCIRLFAVVRPYWKQRIKNFKHYLRRLHVDIMCENELIFEQEKATIVVLLPSTHIANA